MFQTEYTFYSETKIQLKISNKFNRMRLNIIFVISRKIRISYIFFLLNFGRTDNICLFSKSIKIFRRTPIEIYTPIYLSHKILPNENYSNGKRFSLFAQRLAIEHDRE